MVSHLIEQQIFIEFHMKLEKAATETYILLKEVYGNGCLSRTWFLEWFKHFKNG